MTGPSNTIQVVQGSPDNMTHIEAKSINIWLRYDPKHLVSTQTWGDISFWVISQPNVNGFCSSMDNLKATVDAICIEGVSSNHFLGKVIWLVFEGTEIQVRCRLADPLILYRS